MEEENKYYVILFENKFKGFLIAESAIEAQSRISVLGDGYKTTGRYITRKSNYGKD